MFYEINVSKQYKSLSGEIRYAHFFATTERSITTRSDLRNVYEALVEKFPEPEYKLSVTCWEKKGRQMTQDDIDHMIYRQEPVNANL